MDHYYANVPEDLASLGHREVVELYERGASIPNKAIEGLSEEDLTAFPVPNTWSIKQIVVHLADTDSISIYRMKRIISEENPAWDIYDENALVTALDYQSQNATDVAEMFALNRRVFTQVLRGLSDEAFARTAQHAEVGALTLGNFLRLYVHHVRHHLEFILKKREMLGKGIEL